MASTSDALRQQAQYIEHWIDPHVQHTPAESELRQIMELLLAAASELDALRKDRCAGK